MYTKRNHSGIIGKMRKPLMALALPVAAVALTPRHSQATIVTLTSGSDTASINTASATGLYSLSIGGVQQGSQQWFYYTLGSAAGPAVSLNTLGVPTVAQSVANAATLTYAGSYNNGTTTVPFNIGVQYTLTSGVSGAAALTDAVTIKDLSATATLPMRFYEYNNFCLDGTTKDVVSITANDTATQTVSGSSVNLVETATSPKPAYYQAATSPNLLNEFAGASFDHLNDAAVIPAADATYAFEWDPTVAANGTFTDDPTRNFTNVATTSVPEPATGLTAVAGLSLLLARRRRNGR